jgi:hypothetical protein
VAQKDKRSAGRLAVHRPDGTSALRLTMPLNFDRTPDGVDHTCELQQQTVAHGLHDATAMRGDYRINYCHTNGLNRRQCAALVSSHQSRVARYVV